MGERNTVNLSIPNDNMLFHIFQELPVKSLLRFKCISKTWCSIIEDPYFVDSYRIRSHTRSGGISLLVYKLSFIAPLRSPAIFLVDPEGNSEPIELPTPPNFPRDPKGNISRHVEGLVCFSNYIWNPSTQKVIKLPDQEGGLIPYYKGSGNYSIDNKYMLRFDAPSKTYKVLSICNISCITSEYFNEPIGDSQRRAVAQVLTLGTNSWRNLDCMPEEVSSGFAIDASCYTDNVIFCLISFPVIEDRSNTSNISLHPMDVLLAFEVRNEKFRVIHFPNDLQVPVFPFEVRGRFAIIDQEHSPTIWILQDYKNERWDKWKIINFPQDCVLQRFLDANGTVAVTPIGTIHTEEILFKATRIPEGLVFSFYYNFETGNIRMIPPIRIPVGPWETIALSKHVETIILSKAG